MLRYFLFYILVVLGRLQYVKYDGILDAARNSSAEPRYVSTSGRTLRFIKAQPKPSVSAKSSFSHHAYMTVLSDSTTMMATDKAMILLRLHS